MAIYFERQVANYIKKPAGSSNKKIFSGPKVRLKDHLNYCNKLNIK